MPNPTASAPADASPAAAPQSYRWEVSGKPLAIEIRLDVVERLDQEVVRTFRAITSRGSEIGGLLLGHVRQGPRPVVVIEDYETVPCDYERGPLYLLAEQDRRRLEQALARWREAPPQGPRVVGYFRSNTRKELQLDDEDVALLRQYFPDPQQVCLLVKPFASRANLAGFFLWEGSEPQRRSDLTFAFNRAELSKSLASPSAPAAAEVGETKSTAAPAPPAGADGKPAGSETQDTADSSGVSRPTIEVRIALAEAGTPSSKRQAAATPPLAEETDPVQRERVARAEPQRAERSPDGRSMPAPLVVPTDGQPTADGRVQAEEERGPGSKGISQPARLLIRAEEPRPPAAELPTTGTMPEGEHAAGLRSLSGQAETQIAPAKSSKRSRAVLGLIGLVVLGAGAAAVWNFSRGRTPASQPETASLNLRVERSGGQLLLSWNRSLPLLQTAQRAILSISDGDHREDVEMDLGQLRSGSIVYSPITSDVSFRLEVTDLKNGKSVSESVRVLGGRPSPSGPPAEAASAKPAESEAPAEGARIPRQPLRAMAPIPGRDQRESLAARLSPVEPIPAASSSVAEIPARTLPVPAAAPPQLAADAPVTSSTPSPVPAQGRALEQAPAQGSPTEQLSTPAPATSPTKPERAMAPEPAQPAGQQGGAALRVGGQVQEARLIRRREPVYPALARQARIQGVVRLEAVIGPDGRVEKVQAISGPPLLRQAAVDAVKEWVYEPGRLNGRPVSVTTQIEINFTLGR
ncbi:MAG: TonB family protein [Bryobacterales bacterium]|nr:TonB family protein [Bryobacteraceae bacterium]MDW8131310.1 TonB family protein [Bryobacterales bacterium]